MRVLHVASEVSPWAQTGGLADVVAALPLATTALSSDIRTATVVPLYQTARARLATAEVSVGDGLHHEVVVGAHRVAVRLRPIGPDSAARLWLLDCPELYDRPGFYEQPSGGDWPDNPLRFAVLSRAAVDLAPAILGGDPDVIHGHDWQAGLAPIYSRRDGRSAATVFTVHNLAYRGVFGKHVMNDLGLPWTLFNHQQLEFWDQVSFLKGGMAFSDIVTTVSPTYAEEIRTPERGEGLNEFLCHDVRRLVGIVNGIDQETWNPATDPVLPARFDALDRSGKAICREAVCREVGLTPDRNSVLAVAIARMTTQKGLDLLADLAPEFAEMGLKLIILGAGDSALEQRWRALGSQFADTIAVQIGFDSALSRRLYASADLFIMPSRFEPCGLGQLYAMRYGAVPVVSGVGGLCDTVVDPPDSNLAVTQRTGFRFWPVSADNLRTALRRAMALRHANPAGFDQVRVNGMNRDSSWTTSAHAYVRAYRTAQTVR